jgi:hypothetical protein
VSRAADEEAELTEATSATETQRRLQNERRTTVSGGGASWARSQSEREGKGARLSAQLSGEGRVSVGGVQKRLGAWGRGQKTRGRGRVHGRERGRFGGTVLTGGAHGTERDSERTSGWANERGLRIIERGGRAREGSWR